MSIFFDFKLGSRSWRFRKAVDQDKTEIEALWNPEDTDTLFNVQDVGLLIERATLSICMINDDMKVLGFLSLTDHPNVPALDPAHWEMWVRNMFQKFYLSRDTLFIELICCEESVADFFLDEAFASVFLNDAYLKQIVLVVSPACQIDCMENYPPFKKRGMQNCKYSSKMGDSPQCYYLYVAERQDFCPRMKVRRAVEEDNDDIVEILHDECPQLIDLYGEFYISEMISRHPESNRKVMVCELKDKVVGVMSLTADVNYKMLQSTYELGPYNGLLRPSAAQKEEIKRGNDLLTTFGDPILLGQFSPFDHGLFNLDTCPRLLDDIIDQEPSAMKINMPVEDKVLVDPPKKMVRHSVQPVTHNVRESWDDSQDFSLSLLLNNSISILLEEDDPFEYDIVNIDAELLQTVEFSLMDLGNHDADDAKVPRRRYSVRRCSMYKKRSNQYQVSSSETQMETDYAGEHNAFAIELLGLSESIDVRRTFDLLEAAFECMPKYDYCIIRVPCADKSLFLLQHFAFVPTRPNICSKYALYIAHRNSVLGKLRVRRAEFGDIPQIAYLLHNLEAKETLWTIEYSIAHPRQHVSFVFLCGCSVIGVGIVEPPEDINILTEEFSIDAYHMQKYHMRGQGCNDGFASLKSALLYCAFEPHYRFFIREMLRLSGSSALVWLTSYRNKMITHKANCLVGAMIPLTPRKAGMEFYVNDAKNMISFNAWVLNKKMSSIPKLNVNCRIIVVGGSRTAIGFLHSLLFEDTCPYLTFTSVTLVSPNGLPYSRHFSKAVEMMFPVFRTSRNEYIKCTPFTYYVNVIQGTMVEINKTDKFITIENGRRLHYDLLFLLFGKQYQHPDYLPTLMEKSSIMKKNKGVPQYVRMDVPRSLSDMEIDPQALEFDTPENVFIINTPLEAMRALNFVRALIDKESAYEAKIMVYGATIQTYCCMSALLEVGVAPENIIFVEPFPPEDRNETRVPIFCNVNVDSSVKEIIKSLKIQTYRGYYFQSWKTNEAHLLTSVDLLSYFEFINVECSAFFYYDKQLINIHAFVAIQKCGLAYDGGVLIDHKFQTNDPSIYAAGSSTKYYRRYYADNKQQCYYDAYEVGCKLGEQIRNQLDPMFSKPPPLEKKSSETEGSGSSAPKSTGSCCTAWELPDLKMPKMWCCTLPGGLNYLEVRPPGLMSPNYYVQSLQFNGFVMETFKRGYFKLHMNRDYIVNGITCLTPEPFMLENFKCLYGMSGVVLNNVHLRYTIQKIEDFYDYFTSPWAAFLYHERLHDLMAMVKELRPKNEMNGATLQEILNSIAKEIGDIALSDFSKTLRKESNFEKSQYYATIADYVVEWLAENDTLMPMYLQPCQVVEYYHDLGGHPAFKRRRRTFRYMLKEVIKRMSFSSF